jgi:hypothetical protein
MSIHPFLLQPLFFYYVLPLSFTISLPPYHLRFFVFSSYSVFNPLFRFFLRSLQRPDQHGCVSRPRSYLNRTRARMIKPGQKPMHFPVHPEPQCPHARK